MSTGTVRPQARWLAALAMLAALAVAPAAVLAQKVAPITIVINQSPWFGGFAKVVEAYEKETGNKVNLDVNPFAGSAEKQRNSVRAKDGQFDLLVMNSTWLAEFYHGGFLVPLNEIDPGFKLDPQVINYDDTAYWDPKTKTNNAKTGAVYGVPINGNIQVLYYRADLYEKAGLKVPHDLGRARSPTRAKLHNPPAVYGIVQRGARSASDISYDWMPYLHSHNGAHLQGREGRRLHRHDQQPEAKQALDIYVELAQDGGAAEPRQLRPGAGDPGARHRQGRARDAGDRRVVADGRSDEIGGRRQDEHRGAAARPRRAADAHARAFHRRDPEEHSRRSGRSPRSRS